MKKNMNIFPENRKGNVAMENSFENVMDIMNQMAMYIAMWAAAECGENLSSTYLCHTTVKHSDDLAIEFSRSCEDLADVCSFSFSYFKTIIEASDPTTVALDFQDNAFVVILAGDITVRITFAAS